jgi:3-oxoacyl-[acyl-carrier-protein] synthase-3
MDGPEIFKFTLEEVPRAVDALLARSELTESQVALFVFHQANKFMLDHLRKKLHIPDEKFPIALRNFGNTVSASIPITLCEARRSGRIHANDLVVLVGFGVGYSWASALIRWTVGPESSVS